MPPESPQHRRSSAWKVIASFLIVAPLAALTCTLILMALFFGLAITASGGFIQGPMLLFLAGLGVWSLHSLIASLWLARRGRSILFGLIVGFIILSIGFVKIADDALARTRSNIAWTAKDFRETYGTGCVVLAGWGLTVFLIFRTAFAKPVAPPTASIDEL